MRHTNFILKLIIVLSFIMSTFWGCSDDPVNPNPTASTIINVSGKVVSSSNAPINAATVVIQGKSVTTAADGTFTINDVTKPYTVDIISGDNVYEYQGLNVTTPQLYSPGITGTLNSSTLNVTLPSIGAGQNAILIFTDEANVYRYKNISSPAVTGTINVTWGGASSITGKIIALIYTNTGGVITAYNLYREKSGFTLNNGGTSSYTFTNSDPNIVPGMATITGSMNVPAGLASPSTGVTMKFNPGGSSTSTIYLYTVSGTTFSYNVPTGLPTSPRFFVYGQAYDGTKFSFKYTSVASGSSGNIINLESVTTLSSPPNNATLIDTSTNFSYSTGSGTGINLVVINSPPKRFSIYTNESSVKIPNLSSYGFSLPLNNASTWSSQKHLTFNSTDEMVSTSFYQNSNYNGSTYSDVRDFTTHP